MPKKIRVELDADVAVQIVAFLRAAVDMTGDGRVEALSMIYTDAAKRALLDQLSWEEIDDLTTPRPPVGS